MRKVLRGKEASSMIANISLFYSKTQKVFPIPTGGPYLTNQFFQQFVGFQEKWINIDTKPMLNILKFMANQHLP